MPEYVRVTDQSTGHQYTVTREKFEAFKPYFRELKQDATAPDGSPLPPVYKSSDAAPASDKQADKPVESDK